MYYRLLHLLLVSLLLVVSGCGRRKPPEVALPPTIVSVSQPLSKEVTDYRDFTGRTDAINFVDVRARVTGYIDKVPFKDGDDVKKDELLYEIDPRPYQAALDRAKGDVARLEGQKKLIEVQVDRYTKLVAKQAASQQDLDQYLGQQAENLGSLAAAKAQEAVAKLNLDWCRVTSPINGKISRTYFTQGNLVNQDATLLTTIASIDPMYAYFDVDERAFLRFQEMVRGGKVAGIEGNKLPVLMGLANEDGFPHKGHIDFYNNKLDPLTGTITVRGVFPNADRVLTPGLFGRIRVPVGKPHNAILINERAIGTDQGQKYVFVVNDKDKVERRAIKPGMLFDGLRVIDEGVKPEDWVIVDGLQRVRAGAEVKAEHVPMPVPPGATKSVASEKQ